MKSSNPWTEPFAAINSVDIIKKLSARPAQPLSDLEKYPTELACDMIEAELEDIFVPTQRSCEILLELAESGFSYAYQHYSDKKHFIATCYKEQIDRLASKPIILTGLPGTGKSQLCKALIRMLGIESTVVVNADHAPFPLVSARRIVIQQSQKSIPAILRPLAGPELSKNEARSIRGNILDHYIKWQYQTGTCLILADELQFLTQSEKANVLIAAFSLQLYYSGIPTAIVCNYSLLHRLKERPSAEQQRLLGRPIALLPDSPDSADWEEILMEYQKALPGIFGFSFLDHREEMWSYCAGIKRELVKLLVSAYRRNRKKKCFTVAWDDIEASYNSFEFSGSRPDIELLLSGGPDKNNKKLDLWCPFPLPAEATGKYTHALKKARRNNVAQTVINYSLTQEEREAKETITSIMKGKIAKDKHPAKSIKESSALKAEMLISNVNKIRKV